MTLLSCIMMRYASKWRFNVSSLSIQMVGCYLGYFVYLGQINLQSVFTNQYFDAMYIKMAIQDGCPMQQPNSVCVAKPACRPL